MNNYIDELLCRLREKQKEITELKGALNEAKSQDKAPQPILDSTMKLTSGISELDKQNFSTVSIEQDILKDITNGKSIENKKFIDFDISILKENEDGEFKQKMKEFMKKCPYIDKLKQDSEKYKNAIFMLQNLAVFL